MYIYIYSMRKSYILNICTTWCIDIHRYTYVYTWVYTCIHTDVYICIQVYATVYICNHRYVGICNCIQLHISKDTFIHVGLTNV